jgi:hypothetical protein
VREGERLADTDGADQSNENAYERRNATVHRSTIDGSFTLDGAFGPLQGNLISETMDQCERAELLADWADARERHGDGAARSTSPAPPPNDAPMPSTPSSSVLRPRRPTPAPPSRS